jgi:hypothetical protein
MLRHLPDSLNAGRSRRASVRGIIWDPGGSTRSSRDHEGAWSRRIRSACAGRVGASTNLLKLRWNPAIAQAGLQDRCLRRCGHLSAAG